MGGGEWMDIVHVDIACRYCMYVCILKEGLITMNTRP